MKLLYSFFIIFINYCYGNNNTLQPTHKIFNPVISFKKIYKRHTNFALEKLDNNKKSDFGQTFTFSPLDDFCDTNFEKDNAKFCLKYHHNNWDCIYENCISLSRAVPHYISIVLPPIYYNNETTKQSFLLS